METPDLEARLLIQAVTHFNSTDQILRGAEPLRLEEEKEIDALAVRRMSGEPIDHIMGFKEFYGRRFEISKDVLSPRPETEGLVDEVLKDLKDKTVPHILDLGTGSGAIIVSLLAETIDAVGTAVDLSSKALAVASINAKAHGVWDRLTVLQGDWFEPVEGTFDVIVSNPPYITDAAMETLSPEVRAFDPDLALRGGADGLGPYHIIAAQAGEYLCAGGGLFLEIGYDQGPAVANMIRANGFAHVSVLKDLAGHDRIVKGWKRAN